jgi:NADH dehydrogenase [ubiquinone] 1 alpha subcomplex assembly factor 7
MSALKTILLDEIAAHGPMPLDAYMARALADPEHGYYMQRRPFGAPNAEGGDFITAPEVSQMFGELIGTWLADLWNRMGQPAPFALVELGPGRGTLMADVLRVGQVLPGFPESAQVHFVETSPALRQAQKQAVGKDVTAHWHDDITTLPAMPCLLVANEFFDALPIRQTRKTASGWQEICVGAKDKALVFAPQDIAAPRFSEAAKACLPEILENQAIVETCPQGEAAMEQLCAHIAQHGGAALLIDYGHASKACGDSFQALKEHRFVDPLEAPGMADMTAHVNFPLLAHLAEAADLDAAPVATQGAFLESLGLNMRAQQLMQSSPGRETQIQSERARLAAPDEMGTLFKVLGVAHKAMPPLAGLTLKTDK